MDHNYRRCTGSKVRRHAHWRRTSHSHATHSGAALTERAPPCRRVSMCGATSSGAAPYLAAPLWMAGQKRVIRVKFFRRWFILWDCFKFGLFLSKAPNDSGYNYKLVRRPPTDDWAACIVGRQAAAHRNSSQLTAHVRLCTLVLSYLIISSLYPTSCHFKKKKYFPDLVDLELWPFKSRTISFMVIRMHKIIST
jgi:hypothetical protein